MSGRRIGLGMACEITSMLGSVWLAWATAIECRSERRQFSGNRENVRRETVAAALQGLLASLPAT